MFARLRYERALSPTTLVSVSVGADRFKARDDAFSTTSLSSGITAYREIGRMTLSAGVEVGRLKADDRLQLLPEARKDRLLRFQLGSVFRQHTVGGFAQVSDYWWLRAVGLHFLIAGGAPPPRADPASGRLLLSSARMVSSH